MVFIVKQGPEGQPSIIYIASEAPIATRKEEKETNPIRILYEKALQGAFLTWLSGILVMGLAAGILSKQSEGMLLVAAAYNVTCGAIHILQIGPWVKPKMIAPRTPRPAAFQFVRLAVSLIMWIPASALMFLVLSDDETYDMLQRRSLGRFIGEVSKTTIEAVKNITIAAGCFGVSALMCLPVVVHNYGVLPDMVGGGVEGCVVGYRNEELAGHRLEAQRALQVDVDSAISQGRLDIDEALASHRLEAHRTFQMEFEEEVARHRREHQTTVESHLETLGVEMDAKRAEESASLEREMTALREARKLELEEWQTEQKEQLTINWHATVERQHSEFEAGLLEKKHKLEMEEAKARACVKEAMTQSRLIVDGARKEAAKRRISMAMAEARRLVDESEQNAQATAIAAERHAESIKGRAVASAQNMVEHSNDEARADNDGMESAVRELSRAVQEFKLVKSREDKEQFPADQSSAGSAASLDVMNKRISDLGDKVTRLAVDQQREYSRALIRATISEKEAEVSREDLRRAQRARGPTADDIASALVPMVARQMDNSIREIPATMEMLLRQQATSAVPASFEPWRAVLRRLDNALGYFNISPESEVPIVELVFHLGPLMVDEDQAHRVHDAIRYWGIKAHFHEWWCVKSIANGLLRSEIIVNRHDQCPQCGPNVRCLRMSVEGNLVGAPKDVLFAWGA